METSEEDEQQEVSDQDLNLILDKTRENFYKMQDVVALMARLAQDKQEHAMTDRSLIDVKDQIEGLMSEITSQRYA
jgi:hypothetical protein